MKVNILNDELIFLLKIMFYYFGSRNLNLRIFIYNLMVVIKETFLINKLEQTF